jgi:hypothetical protein
MLPTYVDSRQRAKVFSGMKYPNKDGIRNLNMSNAEVVKDMQTKPVQASEITNDSNLYPYLEMKALRRSYSPESATEKNLWQWVCLGLCFYLAIYKCSSVPGYKF